MPAAPLTAPQHGPGVASQKPPGPAAVHPVSEGATSLPGLAIDAPIAGTSVVALRTANGRRRSVVKNATCIGAATMTTAK